METICLIIERVKQKSASMKARGIAFAIEAIATINEKSEIEEVENIFLRLEKVVLVKKDEFIPHYLVKVLTSFNQAGQGSG